MKKLQILLACSLVAAGYQNNLQASWFRGEPAKAPEKKIDPAKEKTSDKDATGKKKTEQTKIKAEQDRIAQQKKEAENRMKDQENNAKAAADNLNAESLKRPARENSSPASSSWNLSSWFTSSVKAEARATVEKLHETAFDAANEMDPVKKSQKTKETIDTTAEHIEQASGIKTTQADKAQFEKTAESWLKNWSFESFSKWVSSCYDWVFSRSSSVQQAASQPASFNLEHETVINSSTAQPQQPTLRKALESRGDELSKVNKEAMKLEENASDFQKATHELLQQQKVKASSWNPFQ